MVHPKSVDDAMTSHPIPARGETTPDTRPVRDGLDDSPILPFPPGFDPATRLPVEPAGTPEGYGVVTTIGGGALLVDREDEHAPVARFVSLAEGERFIAWLAALTSEVSALREAVDETIKQAYPAWEPGYSFVPDDALDALRAARRDGAP